MTIKCSYTSLAILDCFIECLTALLEYLRLDLRKTNIIAQIQIFQQNFCLIAVCLRNCKLWLLIHMTSKQLFVITVSSRIQLFCGDEGEQKE